MIDLSKSKPDYEITTEFGMVKLYLLLKDDAQKFVGIVSDNTGIHSAVGNTAGGLCFTTNQLTDKNLFNPLTDSVMYKYNFERTTHDIPNDIEVEGVLEVLGESRSFRVTAKKLNEL